MNERGVNFWEAFRFWLKLGFISFGGPAGHIAVMHTELVERKQWIGERRFLHALNYCMLLPGPEATQLAIYIGWLLHGTLGGIVAGLLFVLPSVFVLLSLSAIYVAFGQVPAVEAVFYGMKTAIVAIVAFAMLRLAQRVIRNLAFLLLAISAFVAMLLGVPFPLLIFLAALIGYLGARFRPQWFRVDHAATTSAISTPAILSDDDASPIHTRPTFGKFFCQLLVGLTLWATPLALLIAWQGWEGEHTRMASFFTVTALVTFGGAYAVLPYITKYAVEVYHWLKEGQMIDGLALGETTPGPLIMVVVFVGFMGSWQTTDLGWRGAILGGLIAFYFTFLPSFLFILLGAPFIERARDEPRLTSALSGISAAVVGVILHLAVFFGEKVFLPTSTRVDVHALVLSSLALLALWRFKFGIIPVILACGLAGLLLRFLA